MVTVRVATGKPTYEGDEREAFRVAGEDYNLHVKLAEQEAKRWRDMTRGKSRDKEGIIAPLMTIPQAIADAAIRTFNEMYTDGEAGKKDFYCYLWHSYPSLRCSPFPRCHWCGKLTRKFTVKT